MPFVSVLIPAWNEEVNIQKTVRSLLKNSYKFIEVIVINDGSTDKTADKVEELRKEYSVFGDVRVKLITQPNAGKAAALNRGISQAQGEIIITIDADSYVYPDAIERIVRRMLVKNYDYATGQIVVANNTRTFLGISQYFEYKSGFDYKKYQDVTSSIFVLPGCFTAATRELMIRAGGFRVGSLCEDIDLTFEFMKLGAKGGLVYEAKVATEVPETLPELVKQRVRWRLGAWTALWKNKNLLFSPKLKLWYSFIELPISVFNNIIIFFAPLLFFYLWINPNYYTNFFDFLKYFLLYSLFISYPILIDFDSYKLKNLKIFIYLPLVNIICQMISFIEFFVGVKALLKFFSSKAHTWEKLHRTGI